MTCRNSLDHTWKRNSTTFTFDVRTMPSQFAAHSGSQLVP